mmetsp:Transcript_8870/g.15055  ORF Transcript_8870/g.15055 Transcript_8870/m.15055 type:complete len:130 (+) Transcript_8870:360-749(+)
MLRRDHDLRLSPEVQARYRTCGDDPEAKEAVTSSVQRQVVREAGFDCCVRDGVELLQSCMSLFPDDATLVNAAFYLKNNINMPCPIAAGSLVPVDVALHELTSSSVRPRTLREIISRAPLTVLCAGSAT